jgi:5'-nucleotidase
MSWNMAVDEAMFLGGLPKGEFLREFEPDFFFDDQTGHVTSAALHVPAGHVRSGIANQGPSPRLQIQHIHPKCQATHLRSTPCC